MSNWKKEKRKNKVRADAKYSIEKADIACRLISSGCTYDDVGYILGLSGHTIQSWQQRYPVFKEKLDEARKAVNAITLAQLLRCAWGYDYDEITETYVPQAGDEGEIQKIKTVKVHKKHQPPNPELLKFVLLNRAKGDWQDVKRIDVKSSGASFADAVEAEKEAIDALAGRLVKVIESREVDESGEKSGQSGEVPLDSAEKPQPEYSI